MAWQGTSLMHYDKEIGYDCVDWEANVMGKPFYDPLPVEVDLLPDQWFTLIPGEMRTYWARYIMGPVHVPNEMALAILEDDRFGPCRTYYDFEAEKARLTFETNEEAILFKLLFC